MNDQTPKGTPKRPEERSKYQANGHLNERRIDQTIETIEWRRSNKSTIETFKPPKRRAAECSFVGSFVRWFVRSPLCKK